MTVDQAGRASQGARPVPSLTRWGGSPAADLCYRYLLGYGPATVAAAARELGMPRSRVAEAVEELRTLGAAGPEPLANRARPEDLCWRARPPEQLVLRRSRADAPPVRPVDLARRHLAVITGLDLPWPESATGAAVRLLPGPLAARDRIATLTAHQRHERLTIDTRRYADADTGPSDGVAPGDRALLGRGVEIKVLATATGDPELDRCPEFVRRGGLRRVADELPIKLITFDRRIALVPVDPLDPARGAVEIADPTVVATLAGVFDRTWARSRDPHAGQPPDIVLTAREAELVRLLATGHTDATAAQQLGVSVRTVGYTIRGLMDRYGVENRFQLGLVLASFFAELPGAAPRVTPSDV